MSRFALTGEFEELLGRPIPERSQNAMVRCPFHDDGTPSMSIDLQRGLWVCFSCGEKGTIFSLAERLGGDLNDTRVLLRVSEASSQQYEEPPDYRQQAEEYHREAWRTQAPEIVRYIASRGLSPKVFRKFKLGWNGKSIVMPYYDDDRVVALKYRAPDGFKWYEPGSRRCIYNVNDIRARPFVILCEGESDTHAVWSYVDGPTRLWHNVGVGGIPGVGAGQPSRSTWELWSLELMWAKRVYIAFDADEAGDAGSRTPMSLLGEKAVRLRPTKGKDMAEHLMKGGEIELEEEDRDFLVAQGAGEGDS